MLVSVFSLVAVDDSQLFYQAERKFEAADYASALIDYEELIRQYPLSDHLADAQYRRAVALFRLNRTEESLKLFLRVRERYGSGLLTDTLAFWLGVNYYALEDFSQSVKELSLYIKNRPNGEFWKEALLTLAFAQYKNGEGEAALETALKLSDMSLDITDEPEALAIIFSLFLKFEEYEKLVRFSQTYDLSLLPGKFQQELTYYRGEAHFHLKNYEEAQRDFQWCLQSATGEVAAGSAQRLFTLYRIQRNYDELNRLMETAEERFSDRPEVINALRLKYGIEKFKLKRYDDTILYLNRIWTKESTSTMDDLVPLYLAQAFGAKGEVKRAFEILQQYQNEAKENRATVSFLMARYGAEIQQWSAVEAAAKDFLQLSPESPETESAAYYLILSLLRQQKWTQAKDAADYWSLQRPAIKSQRRFMQLKLEIAEGLGDLSYSVQSLDQYLQGASKDDQALLTFLKQNFKAKDFKKILSTTDKLYKERPQLKNEGTPLSSFVAYIRALSFVSLKQYQQAIALFESLSPEKLVESGWEILLSYYFYYKGWAYYRVADYEKALEQFRIYVTESSEGEFYLQSLYLCGWSCYSSQNFEEAAQWFLSYGEKEVKDERLKAALLAGKSYAAAGKYDKAEEVFIAVISSAPRRLKTEALYEYALLLKKNNFLEKSADVFMLIFKEDSQSEEAEGALLTAAEIYREQGAYQKAILAYTDFVATYAPSQQRLQALGELAQLLYQQERYSEAARVLGQWNSADTTHSMEERRLVLRCQLAMKQKAWEEATLAWNELLREFPAKAKEMRASFQLAKLYYLRLGKSDQEAELSLQFSRGGGTDTLEGRTAAVLLASIHFQEKNEEEMENSIVLLEEIINKYPQDKKNGAASRFWLAWLLYERKEYAEALPHFVEAIATDGSADFVPEALFKAAQSAQNENQQKDAQTLFARLKTHFPSSEWAQQIPTQRRRQ